VWAPTDGLLFQVRRHATNSVTRRASIVTFGSASARLVGVEGGRSDDCVGRDAGSGESHIGAQVIVAPASKPHVARSLLSLLAVTGRRVAGVNRRCHIWTPVVPSAAGGRQARSEAPAQFIVLRLTPWPWDSIPVRVRRRPRPGKRAPPEERTKEPHESHNPAGLQSCWFSRACSSLWLAPCHGSIVLSSVACDCHHVLCAPPPAGRSWRARAVSCSEDVAAALS